ncbi:substrate-binding periplasmic protein [Spartinivicinus ruber]|uniref:substrate-binding periplasmic protein n=1 Tax=Spartinivicinus ruber TaxID=2683272 RepID=UPI0013D08C3D|nr:transporter substrate-binding domain-containing protein [Spartinivicinus ruber]
MTLFNALNSRAAEQPIIIWTYYSSPPFSINNEKREGLTYDFVDLLNKLSPGELTFLAHYIPRNRLDELLQKRNDGIVAWVHPAWFNDKHKQKYLWTPPLIQDTNEVISLVKNSISYKGPESLTGLQLGGVFGHVYSGLEESIKQGAIKRLDVASFSQTLKILIAGRVDFVIIPNNTIRYLAIDMGVSHQICYSTTPHSLYTRHILVQKGQQSAYPFLVKTIENLANNQQWQALLQRYHLINTSIKPCRLKSNSKK